MSDYERQRDVLDQMLANQWPADVDKADPHLVEARITPRFRPQSGTFAKLELEVELIVQAPGLEIATYSASVNFKLAKGGKGSAIRYREAQAWGWAERDSVRFGLGINPVDLPQGVQKGSWVAFAFVKLTEGHYKGWTLSENFEFEIP